MIRVSHFPEETKKKKKGSKAEEPKEEEILSEEKQLALDIVAEKKEYEDASRGRRRTWIECWKGYVSWIDVTKNVFLANLFIPKIHEAVELLAAFLSGPNQSINAEAEGKEDTKKAQLIGKWMEFQWRKVLKARHKIITWIKQAILFGNGVMKVGWDEDKKEPFIQVLNLSDVFFSYWHKDIQDSPSVIHMIAKSISSVKSDEKYNEIKDQVIAFSKMEESDVERAFASYDDTVITIAGKNETILLERTTLGDDPRIQTVAPTTTGWQVIRNEKNPNEDTDGNPFQPYVKVRLKTNPLPNRAYDFGTIEPTLKIQLAFNDMMNEIFDNVSLINNVHYLKRQGVTLTPKSPVRRPGGVTTVACPPGVPLSEAIKADAPPDIKKSAIEMLTILDNEFQQASMVVNLLKGIPGAEFATEAALGQSNLMTMLEPIDGNIKEALSELGQMILTINLRHAKEINSIKVLSDDQKEIWVDVNPEDIQGKYDVRIEADRRSLLPAAVRQKQTVDFMNIVRADQVTLQKYPTLMEKLYKKFLKDSGEGDVGYYFEEAQPQQMQELMPGGAPPGPGGPRRPAPGEGLSTERITKGAESPMIPKGKI